MLSEIHLLPFSSSASIHYTWITAEKILLKIILQPSVHQSTSKQLFQALVFVLFPCYESLKAAVVLSIFLLFNGISDMKISLASGKLVRIQIKSLLTSVRLFPPVPLMFILSHIFLVPWVVQKITIVTLERSRKLHLTSDKIKHVVNSYTKQILNRMSANIRSWFCSPTAGSKIGGLVHLHFVNLKYIVLKLGMKSRNCTICIQCKNINV